MTATVQPAGLRHSWTARRWAALGAIVVALLAFGLWAKHRIDGLSTSTQATNPLIRWEWLFKRPETPGELRAMTQQHLWLTVTAVLAGLVIASLLSLLALRLRWTFAPITAFSGFLYTIPSVALFGLLSSYLSNFESAVVALTSYTLLVLVRNIVAGIDAVPSHVVDAADGLGMGRARRLLTVELPLALPVIIAGIRVAAVTTVGLVAITAVIQLGGLGRLIFDGYNSSVLFKMVIGTILSILLAVALDLTIYVVGALLTPWSRRAR